VFAVAPIEDSTFPGLNPVAKLQDDWTLPRGDNRPPSRSRASTSMSARSANARACCSLPDAGLSLETFGLLPRRDVRATLENPFVSPKPQRG